MRSIVLFRIDIDTAEMNQNTWDYLTQEQRDAVRSMSSRFIKAVHSSKARDGWDFGEKYSVQKIGSRFVITDGTTPLPGISHSDKRVMDVLYGDAIGNYGR